MNNKDIDAFNGGEKQLQTSNCLQEIYWDIKNREREEEMKVRKHFTFWVFYQCWLYWLLHWQAASGTCKQH